MNVRRLATALPLSGTATVVTATPATGNVAFTLTAAVPTTASAPPTTPTSAEGTTTATSTPSAVSPYKVVEEGSVPVWVWILIAAVVLVGGVLAALRLGRPKGS